MGRQLPESMGIAQRAEICFLFVTQYNVLGAYLDLSCDQSLTRFLSEVFEVGKLVVG